MSNTVRKNKTVKGSTKKTNKNDLKTNKTLIAAVSASVAAVTLTAAIALTAVLVAPADKKEVNAPAAAAVTYQAPKTQTPAAPEAVKTTTAKTTTNVTKEVAADNNQNKAVAQTTAAQQAPAQQAAHAAQPQQQAPVSQPETAAQPAAPAETKAQPAAPAETKAQPAAPAETKAQPAAQPAPAAETKTEKQGTPVIPQGEVNDWKTHDAKDGFPIGTFYDKADTHNTLNVVKLDNTNYKITIVQPTSELSATICNIDAEAHGDKMFYKSAVKTSVVYDTNHSITDSKVIEGTHEGTFDASDAGYTMTDTEGTTVFVPWVGYR